MQMLLADGRVDPDSVDNNDRSPLSYAAEDGCAAKVEVLLATKKVNVNLRDKEGRTPLWYARHSQDEGVVALLESAGATM